VFCDGIRDLASFPGLLHPQYFSPICKYGSELATSHLASYLRLCDLGTFLDVGDEWSSL